MPDCALTPNLAAHRVHSPIISELPVPQCCEMVILDTVPAELKGHHIECEWEGYITPAQCGCV